MGGLCGKPPQNTPAVNAGNNTVLRKEPSKVEMNTLTTPLVKTKSLKPAEVKELPKKDPFADILNAQNAFKSNLTTYLGEDLA